MGSIEFDPRGIRALAACSRDYGEDPISMTKNPKVPN